MWRRQQTLRRLLVLVLFLSGVGLVGEGGYIRVKAWLAQILLESAWSAALAGEPDAKPWPWADTTAVGRLDLGPAGGDLIVLSGSSGRTLAFGPGWDQASAVVGDAGVALIGGHRDTHFQALGQLRVGDRFGYQRADGWIQFQVGETRVVDSRQTALVQAREGDRATLVLVTCYPFENWTPGGPLRYLVIADRVADDDRLTTPLPDVVGAHQRPAEMN